MKQFLLAIVAMSLSLLPTAARSQEARVPAQAEFDRLHGRRDRRKSSAPTTETPAPTTHPTAPVVAEACTPPDVEGAKLVVVNPPVLGPVTDVSVGIVENGTAVSRLFVVPGGQALHVVVLTDHVNTIFKFEGDTMRVRHLTVLNQRPQWGNSRFGVLGLRGDKVGFVSSDLCPSRFKESKAEKMIALGRLKSMFGEDVTVVDGAAEMAVSIPSGGPGPALPAAEVMPLPKMPPILDMSRVASRGGVIIDPAKVVSEGEVVRLPVLPQRLGIAQLLAQGALEADSNGSGTYIIRKKITFPTGLCGGYSLKFVVAPGVPEPDGDACHSCVLSADTGMPIRNGSSMQCR